MLTNDSRGCKLLIVIICNCAVAVCRVERSRFPQFPSLRRRASPARCEVQRQTETRLWGGTLPPRAWFFVRWRGHNYNTPYLCFCIVKTDFPPLSPGCGLLPVVKSEKETRRKQKTPQKCILFLHDS